jgi:hypothetical protein
MELTTICILSPILTPSGDGVMIMSTMVRGLSKVLIGLDGVDWQIARLMSGHNGYTRRKQGF